MRPKQFSVFAAVCALLLGILACSIPVDNPPSPEVEEVIVTEFASPIPTNTRTVTATSLPTLDPDDPLTFGGAATATSTFVPTDTPLPPIPEFDDVITFAPGAGGGPCMEMEYKPNYIDVWVNRTRRQLVACFWLQGIDINRPFQISLSHSENANNTELISSNLFFDSSSGKVQGEGYHIEDYFGYWYEDGNGNLSGYFNLWSPTRLLPGTWRFSVSQQMSTFGTFWANFKVNEDLHTNIGALGSRPMTELEPMLGAFNPYHLLIPNDKGKVNVIGENFPSNTLIYILLYQKIPFSDEMQLTSKHVVQSNPDGLVTIELSGPFESGQLYLLIGMSDPDTPLEKTEGLFHNFNWELPIDAFKVEKSSASFVLPNSCPGAPPQRMIINKRGYVCTKGDNVRLRNTPNRSGSAIDSLSVGTQFTVLDGPSCADNWSWWQVRTDYGATGWIAEGGDNVDPYFICPLE